ncbi:hypothetical protein ACUN0C_17545 [Faunimonas sp. B44]
MAKNETCPFHDDGSPWHRGTESLVVPGRVPALQPDAYGHPDEPGNHD